ncbi:MAG: sodium transporter, partial [Bacteroidota bacterium]
DAIQMIILVVGILVCTGYALSYLGGFEALQAQVDPDRLNILDFNWGIGEGQEFGFWPMVIGGFFLYASYYGCDQSQAQRSLSGRSLRQVQGALMLNGLVRFPIVLCYCLMGLIVGTFAAQTPEFMEMIPANDPDQMMPLFIAHYLPHGILGLLIIAILASAMSSLSSAVNSLSAASVEDLVLRFRKKPVSEAQRLTYSKLATVFWGVVCLLLAFVGDQIADTIIEAINKIGSVFFGPILATFMLAILSKRAHARAANIGLLAGVALNLYIWLGVGNGLFWIWWNFTGAMTTLTVGLLASYLIPADHIKPLPGEPREWLRWQNVVLLGYFLLMIGICSWLPGWMLG